MLSLVMLKKVEAEEEGKGAEAFSGSGTARKTEKKHKQRVYNDCTLQFLL